MSRQRKVNESAVEKTLSFLNNIKLLNGEKASFSQLQQAWGINKSTYSACKSLGYIKNGQLTIDPDRINALQILEVLRKQSDKRNNTVISPEFVTAIDRLTNSMNTLSLQNEKSLKSPLLQRALNQTEQSQNSTLFSQVESNEAKKFELLKAIAGGVTASWSLNGDSIEHTNKFIIEATEDLFNKFFKVK